MSLDAHHLSYVYRRRRAQPVVAVDDVSISIAPGSLTGLLGPNGCGKTTLLRLLSGVERPTTGTVALDGRDVAAYGRRPLARRIAVVPQETHPAFDYSVLDMVLMGRHPHLGTFEFEGPHDHQVAREALEATGTWQFADRPFSALSGGEKQRVVIASALAQAADILLLDEPTASLDLGAQLDVAALLQTLHRERAVTIVMATHDLNFAASVCDSLVLMKAGRVVAHGVTANVLTAGFVRELYDVDVDVLFNREARHLMVIGARRARDGARHAP
jgi:iron complex transport system ATP-binding protein